MNCCKYHAGKGIRQTEAHDFADVYAGSGLIMNNFHSLKTKICESLSISMSTDELISLESIFRKLAFEIRSVFFNMPGNYTSFVNLTGPDNLRPE
jgi:hypothetical protein